MGRKRIDLYLAALGLCLAFAWFCLTFFDWRALLALVGALGLFIKAERDSAPVVERPEDQNDRGLFAALRAELPRDPTIDFFERLDSSVDFQHGPVQTLDSFWRRWNNAEHKFFDSKLERLRGQLHTAADRCLDLIGKYAMREINDVWRIRTMANRHKEEFESRWRVEAEQVNSSAREVVKHYDEIIRRGRKRFPDKSGS